MNNLIDVLTEVRDRIDVVLAVLGADVQRPAYLTDPLEADGSWRPGWLIDLNDRARKHVPSGWVHEPGRYRGTPMTLIHSILWWPIYYDRSDLTDQQRAEYEAAQRDGWARWMQIAPTDTPIMSWPRSGEDIAKPGAEIRHAVLAAPKRADGRLPTESALRAAVERHYRRAGYLPSA